MTRAAHIASFVALLAAATAWGSSSEDSEPTDEAEETSAPAENAYELGAGDTISIEVFKEDDLSRTLTVPSSCTVELPLIGAVSVCGRTPRGLADHIEERLADGYLVNPVVTTDVVTFGSQRVEVVGAVKEPGVVVLTGTMTLSELVASRGGPTDATVLEVEHVRADGTTETDRVSQLPTAGSKTYVSAGDVVILRKGRRVFVHGEVRKEGPVPFEEGLTALQALGLAGGPGDFAGLRRAYVLRADGSREPINLKRIADGKDPDVVLGPDDQLVIRRSIF